MANSRAEPQVGLLVVEDDADTRANLCDILELTADWRVDAVATARAAMERIGQSRYTAILLDRLLPDGDAQEVLPELRKLSPDAAAIIITGRSDVEGAIDALRLGAVDYILKPVNVDWLRFRLRRIMDERRAKEARERTDAVFRNLIEAAECMIIILRANGTVAYFSPFAEQMTGYSAAEVAGRSYLELFVANADQQSLATIFQASLEPTFRTSHG